MLNGKTFQKLKKNGVKGENGTIVVIGGSYMYTGAPVFSALASLRSGSELVYVFTAKEAVNSIKAVLEAVVMPFEFNEIILDKATACIIGPGLGRLSEDELSLITKIACYLDSRNIPFVLDADAIHFYKMGVFANLKTVILTPNYREAEGLIPNQEHLCIYKGKVDLLRFKNKKLFVSCESSAKRCGGQGDILSGILATALSIDKINLLDAALSSCELLRATTALTFKKKGFSMITSDVLDTISEVLSTLTTN
ncbi:hypothetical protein GINT2_000486 [Glugoides intestinalis]